ncbi:hypothetical protein RAL08_004499 [Vibrio parahaemolyticus]|uniref:hypothetical protein n=1 Tax=Vibrio parahaemolyticus TaxID=670 RepID=UPI00215C0BAE|nr:hypothetical protein [Vibrio parahaemolyticus]ELA7195914.1 hypothetical protein [Vibrio parahaemolyticus]MCR9511595.1 hypothetical protein [Vibrio parahaemolyticus]MCS0119793.1 hypothetical protein [Vibrio parahaemolyticus]
MNKNQILREFRCKAFSVIKKFKALAPETIKTIKVDAASLSDDLNIKKIHNEFPTNSLMLAPNYLYIVEFSENITIEQIKNSREAFRRVRESKDINFSRDNIDNDPHRTIYVGTSQGIKERFRTHLGVGKGRSTWALYLSEWLEEEVIITTVPLLNFTQDETQLIEDVIWDSCKPMFGKKGGK